MADVLRFNFVACNAAGGCEIGVHFMYAGDVAQPASATKLRNRGDAVNLIAQAV